MNREESLEHFKENVAKKLVYEYKLKFQENFKANEENIKTLIVEGIKAIDKKAKEANENYRITVLQFELLRINILKENYKIWIHGYNSLWYLDEDSIYEEIDLKNLFEHFNELKEKLIKDKKIYMGKVNNYDIQEIIFDLAVECYNNMSVSARNWLWNLDEEEWINECAFSDFYTIKWSEYHGKSETIFTMDNREKNINELLELKKQSKEKLPFVYTVWKNSTLEDGDLTKQNMLFINFKESRLRKIDFSESDIIRGRFKDTELNYCEFKSSKLVGTSFENSKIEDCNFNNADCTAGDFRKAELNYVDFSNTNLKNANFTNVKFYNVTFEGADVEEAIFSEKDIPFIHLSPEQLQAIYIDGGKEA